MFAPESPRWLQANAFDAEAEQALARIRGVQVQDNDVTVKQNFAEIKDAVRDEAKLAQIGWLECFRPERKILYRCVKFGDHESFD